MKIIYKIVFLFLLLTSASFSLLAASQIEKQALIDLYTYTDGGNWDDNTGWLSGDPCDWHGVRCIAGKIIYLYLSQNNLRGEIPSSIGNLVNLIALHLERNQLTGEIPSSIGNLVNSLSDVRLDRNQLTGEIPSTIGNLVNLWNLILDGNQLTGEIPPAIGNLVNLNALYLHGNQLSADARIILRNQISLN